MLIATLSSMNCPNVNYIFSNIEFTVNYYKRVWCHKKKYALQIKENEGDFLHKLNCVGFFLCIFCTHIGISHVWAAMCLQQGTAMLIFRLRFIIYKHRDYCDKSEQMMGSHSTTRWQTKIRTFYWLSYLAPKNLSPEVVSQEQIRI